MRYYFAPMEGLTDSIYRRLHHKYFPGVDRYYMPFISPTIHRSLTHKEDRELPLADSVDFSAVPQVLTKVSDDFLWAAGELHAMGYGEVNLNLGCPSGTVTAKRKGSGLLAYPEELKRFLDGIFARCGVDISVKTRLGKKEPEEFEALLALFSRYPMKELIIHPRVQPDFYKGTIRMAWYDYAQENTALPLCYNGDLISLKKVQAFEQEFPQVEAVMIGRGLVADPGLLCGGTDVKALEDFMNALLKEYTVAFGGSRNAMFRLKENWGFLIHKFEGSEKLWKRLRKTTDVSEFRSITAQIFHTLPLKPELGNEW